MDKLVEKIGKKRLVALLIVAIVAFSIFAVFFHMNDNSADFSGREVRVIITDSMDGDPMPYEIETIPVNTLVMVRKISDSEKENIQVGDVIQFWYGDILDHHRVVENNVEGHYMVTKGDNSSTTETVSYDKIRGIVVGTNHFLGQIFIFVKMYVLFILVLIVVLYIASRLMEEIILERREKER